jgi:uncharacterized membrane protein YphA (DoxX/SURF4 family)
MGSRKSNDPPSRRRKEKNEMQAIAPNRLRGWGATVLRAVVGLIFVAHGAQKLFGEGFGGVAGMMEGLGMPAPPWPPWPSS